MRDIELGPDEIRPLPQPHRRRTFKEWLLGDAEQLAHEKKAWGMIGMGVLWGVAYYWMRHH